MIFRNPRRSSTAAPASRAQQTPWETSVEVDLHMTMAFSRASLTAMMALSPHAAAIVRDALASEVDALREQNDPHSLAAVAGVLELLQKAA